MINALDTRTKNWDIVIKIYSFKLYQIQWQKAKLSVLCNHVDHWWIHSKLSFWKAHISSISIVKLGSKVGYVQLIWE